jgi:DNA polymerase III delta prime subunit
MDNLLANKYKPKNISDFIYDDDIKNTLHELIDIDEISIILYGETGCGKTTLIDCIIKQYYGDTKYYQDNILYINNITDQGINYYRNDVKLFCQTNCTIRGKKKLILLDDFDQINDQSQQVFRNYIDKYQNTIGFIISTCNLHKIINSIQSRFLVLNLTKPSYDEVKLLCNTIVKAENIQINEPLIDNILQLTNNTIYNTFNYLEKMKLIDIDSINDDFSEVLTHINNKSFNLYFDYMRDKNFYSSLTVIKTIYDDGFSVIDILDALFVYIKGCTTLSDKERYKIVPIICKYITTFYDIHEDSVELIFLTNNLMNIF